MEFDTDDEKREVVASLQTNSKLKGKIFWTGGLNPGLLWIWASSAKPVFKNTKQSIPGDGRYCSRFNSFRFIHLSIHNYI